MLNHAATQLTREPAPPAIDDSAESGTAAQAPSAAVASPHSEAADGQSDDSAESLRARAATSRPEQSVLHQRADAAKRAFNRADALVSVAQGYLRGDRPQRSPIEITVTIPQSGLRADMTDPTEVGEMGESFLSTEAVRRLSCDASMLEVVEGEHGTPLSVGRKRRTIAGALKRALHKRDVTCTYPGCTHRIFLEGHHIKRWADGGETSLNTRIVVQPASSLCPRVRIYDRARSRSAAQVPRPRSGLGGDYNPACGQHLGP